MWLTDKAIDSFNWMINDNVLSQDEITTILSNKDKMNRLNGNKLTTYFNDNIDKILSVVEKSYNNLSENDIKDLYNLMLLYIPNFDIESYKNNYPKLYNLIKWPVTNTYDIVTTDYFSYYNNINYNVNDDFDLSSLDNISFPSNELDNNKFFDEAINTSNSNSNYENIKTKYKDLVKQEIENELNISNWNIEITSLDKIDKDDSDFYSVWLPVDTRTVIFTYNNGSESYRWTFGDEKLLLNRNLLFLDSLSKSEMENNLDDILSVADNLSDNLSDIYVSKLLDIVITFNDFDLFEKYIKKIKDNLKYMWNQDTIKVSNYQKIKSFVDNNLSSISQDTKTFILTLDPWITTSDVNDIKSMWNVISWWWTLWWFFSSFFWKYKNIILSFINFFWWPDVFEKFIPKFLRDSYNVKIKELYWLSDDEKVLITSLQNNLTITDSNIDSIKSKLDPNIIYKVLKNINSQDLNVNDYLKVSWWKFIINEQLDKNKLNKFFNKAIASSVFLTEYDSIDIADSNIDFSTDQWKNIAFLTYMFNWSAWLEDTLKYTYSDLSTNSVSTSIDNVNTNIQTPLDVSSLSIDWIDNLITDSDNYSFLCLSVPATLSISSISDENDLKTKIWEVKKYIETKQTEIQWIKTSLDGISSFNISSYNIDSCNWDCKKYEDNVLSKMWDYFVWDCDIKDSNQSQLSTVKNIDLLASSFFDSNWNIKNDYKDFFTWQQIVNLIDYEKKIEKFKDNNSILNTDNTDYIYSYKENLNSLKNMSTVKYDKDEHCFSFSSNNDKIIKLSEWFSLENINTSSD